MDVNGPYESPIEQYLFIKMRSHLAPGVTLTPQVSYKTQCGIFRIDGLLTFAEQKVAIECDGAEYHDRYRDEWRDAILLGEKHVDAVLRFSGANIIDVPLACLSEVARWYPEAFNERGRIVLERSRSEIEIIDDVGDAIYGRYMLNGEERFFIPSRRAFSIGGTWFTKYLFAETHPACTIDRIIEQWKQSDRGAARVVNRE